MAALSVQDKRAGAPLRAQAPRWAPAPRRTIRADDADLPRPRRDDPGAPRGARGHAAVPRRARSATPSAHAFGRRPARRSTTPTSGSPAPIGADAREIVFTSGGTEAINLALEGRGMGGRARGHRIVTSASRAPRRRAHAWASREVRLRGRRGAGGPLRPRRPRRRRARDHRPDHPRDVMLANNEVGTIQPVAEVARVCAPTAASCSTSTPSRPPRGWTSTSQALGADLVSLAAHKVEGPKGTGALWIRRGTHILAQQHGGSQERHRRAGTENVAGAVGMADGRSSWCRRAHRIRRPGQRAPGAPGGGHPRRRGRGAHRPPGRAAAAHPVDRRSRRRRRVGRARAGPRGDRLFDGFRVHQRVH